MKNKSPSGEKYFMLLIDDYTGMPWINLLKFKDEDFEKFKMFKALVKNKIDIKIKCLIYNRGGEFISYEFDICDHNGIKR